MKTSGLPSMAGLGGKHPCPDPRSVMRLVRGMFLQPSLLRRSGARTPRDDLFTSTCEEDSVSQMVVQLSRAHAGIASHSESSTLRAARKHSSACGTPQ